VLFELYEASKQTLNPWIFEPKYPGKSGIFDGRTWNPFEQPVIIGKHYILKLIHQVDDKIHGRSTKYYALVTQHPFKGRAKQRRTMGRRNGVLGTCRSQPLHTCQYITLTINFFNYI